MAGQNFEREDDLATDTFDAALWAGLRGGAPYPRCGTVGDQRRNRQWLLNRYYGEISRLATASG